MLNGQFLNNNLFAERHLYFQSFIFHHLISTYLGVNLKICVYKSFQLSILTNILFEAVMRNTLFESNSRVRFITRGKIFFFLISDGQIIELFDLSLYVFTLHHEDKCRYLTVNSRL